MGSIWFTLFGSKTVAALARAAESGDVARVRSILPHIDAKALSDANALSEARPEAREGDPLYIAASTGDLAIVQLLLEHRHAGMAVFGRRTRALVAAAENGHADVVAELLRHGPLNVPGHCMYEVAKRGHVSVARLLVPYCAGLDTTICLQLMTQEEDRDHDDTVIGVAARNGHRDVVELLLAHGVSLNTTSQSAYTPRHGPLDSAASRGDIEMMRTLLEHGASVNGTGETSPLHCAAKHGHLAAMELLLAAGADIHRREDKRWNENQPLHEAVRWEQLEAARLLLERGADVNAIAGRGEYMYTPLYLGTASDRIDLMQLLLEHGADPNGRTGRRPLNTAAGSGCIAAMKVLLGAGADPSASLGEAAAAKDTAAVELLLEAGADIKREQPLRHAVKYMNVDAIPLLLKWGVDVNEGYQERDGSWTTPLQELLRKQDEDDRWAGADRSSPSAQSVKCAQIIRLLREHTDQQLPERVKRIRAHLDSKRVFGVLRAPNIRDIILRKASACCAVPQSADILALLVDLSVSPHDDVIKALAICTDGIRYGHWKRSPEFIPYDEFIHLTISVDIFFVRIGPQRSSFQFERISNKDLCQLLTDIQIILQSTR